MKIKLNIEKLNEQKIDYQKSFSDLFLNHDKIDMKNFTRSDIESIKKKWHELTYDNNSNRYEQKEWKLFLKQNPDFYEPDFLNRLEIRHEKEELSNLASKIDPKKIEAHLKRKKEAGKKAFEEFKTIDFVQTAENKGHSAVSVFLVLSILKEDDLEILFRASYDEKDYRKAALKVYRSYMRKNLAILDADILDMKVAAGLGYGTIMAKYVAGIGAAAGDAGILGVGTAATAGLATAGTLSSLVGVPLIWFMLKAEEELENIHDNDLLLVLFSIRELINETHPTTSEDLLKALKEYAPTGEFYEGAEWPDAKLLFHALMNTKPQDTITGSIYDYFFGAGPEGQQAGEGYKNKDIVKAIIYRQSEYGKSTPKLIKKYFADKKAGKSPPKPEQMSLINLYRDFNSIVSRGSESDSTEDLVDILNRQGYKDESVLVLNALKSEKFPRRTPSGNPPISSVSIREETNKTKEKKSKNIMKIKLKYSELESQALNEISIRNVMRIVRPGGKLLSHGWRAMRQAKKFVDNAAAKGFFLSAALRKGASLVGNSSQDIWNRILLDNAVLKDDLADFIADYTSAVKAGDQTWPVIGKIDDIKIGDGDRQTLYIGIDEQGVFSIGASGKGKKEAVELARQGSPDARRAREVPDEVSPSAADAPDRVGNAAVYEIGKNLDGDFAFNSGKVRVYSGEEAARVEANIISPDNKPSKVATPLIDSSGYNFGFKTGSKLKDGSDEVKLLSIDTKGNIVSTEKSSYEKIITDYESMVGKFNGHIKDFKKRAAVSDGGIGFLSEWLRNVEHEVVIPFRGPWKKMTKFEKTLASGKSLGKFLFASPVVTVVPLLKTLSTSLRANTNLAKAAFKTGEVIKYVAYVALSISILAEINRIRLKISDKWDEVEKKESIIDKAIVILGIFGEELPPNTTDASAAAVVNGAAALVKNEDLIASKETKLADFAESVLDITAYPGRKVFAVIFKSAGEIKTSDTVAGEKARAEQKRLAPKKDNSSTPEDIKKWKARLKDMWTYKISPDHRQSGKALEKSKGNIPNDEDEMNRARLTSNYNAHIEQIARELKGIPSGLENNEHYKKLVALEKISLEESFHNKSAKLIKVNISNILN